MAGVSRAELQTLKEIRAKKVLLALHWLSKDGMVCAAFGTVIARESGIKDIHNVWQALSDLEWTGHITTIEPVRWSPFADEDIFDRIPGRKRYVLMDHPKARAYIRRILREHRPKLLRRELRERDRRLSKKYPDLWDPVVAR